MGSAQDEHLYAIAVDEVATGDVDTGTMAKAFTMANGKPEAAILNYLRLRVQALARMEAEAARQARREKARAFADLARGGARRGAEVLGGCALVAVVAVLVAAILLILIAFMLPKLPGE
jgi:hypothetical protein